MSVAILGSGIAGLSAALELRQNSVPVDIYEMNSVAGGLCRTKSRDGFTFDVASHVLHFKSTDNQRKVHDLLNGQLVHADRSAFIYFRSRHIPYPFQTHIGFLPWADRFACTLGRMKAALEHRTEPASNFKEWVNRQFGSGVADRFLLPYNAKLWGVPTDALSLDWVGSFVPSTTPMQAVRGLLRSRIVQGYNSSFSYPAHGGIQALPDAMSAGFPIQFEREVVEIDLQKRTLLFRGRDNVATYSHLVSSIPLKTLASKCIGMPDELRQTSEELSATSLLSITFALRKPLPHRYHWIYFAEPEYPFFRLFFPSNVADGYVPNGCSMISAEISNPDPATCGQIESACIKQLTELGYIQHESEVVFADASFFEHAYPIHDLRRKANVKKLCEYFRSHGVWCVGRFGKWEYSGIESAMADGTNAAQQIIAGIA